MTEHSLPGHPPPPQKKGGSATHASGTNGHLCLRPVTVRLSLLTRRPRFFALVTVLMVFSVLNLFGTLYRLTFNVTQYTLRL